MESKEKDINSCLLEIALAFKKDDNTKSFIKKLEGKASSDNIFHSLKYFNQNSSSIIIRQIIDNNNTNLVPYLFCCDPTTDRYKEAIENNKKELIQILKKEENQNIEILFNKENFFSKEISEIIEEEIDNNYNLSLYFFMFNPLFENDAGLMDKYKDKFKSKLERTQILNIPNIKVEIPDKLSEVIFETVDENQTLLKLIFNAYIKFEGFEKYIANNADKIIQMIDKNVEIIVQEKYFNIVQFLLVNLINSEKITETLKKIKDIDNSEGASLILLLRVFNELKDKEIKIKQEVEVFFTTFFQDFSKTNIEPTLKKIKNIYNSEEACLILLRVFNELKNKKINQEVKVFFATFFQDFSENESYDIRHLKHRIKLEREIKKIEWNQIPTKKKIPNTISLILGLNFLAAIWLPDFINKKTSSSSFKLPTLNKQLKRLALEVFLSSLFSVTLDVFHKKNIKNKLTTKLIKSPLSKMNYLLDMLLKIILFESIS